MQKYFLPLLALLSMLSCAAQKSDGEKLGQEEFEKQISVGKVVLLDVRTAEEYKAGHLKGAFQADWNNRIEFEERIKYIDKASGVYVYCAAGSRSAAAAAWMRSNGFGQVSELNGGFINWKKNGKSIEEVTAVKQMTLEEYHSMIPSNTTVLVDFGAKWCIPCVRMEPVLNEVKEELKNKFTLVKIEAGIHTDIQQSLGIESYPTFIIYQNGKETWRQSGIVEKPDLLSHLRH